MCKINPHLNPVKVKIHHLSTICILNKVAGLLLNSFLCHFSPPWILVWNVILTATRVCKSCLNAALECTVSAFWEFVEHIFVFILTEPWLKKRDLPGTSHTDLHIHSMWRLVRERERSRRDTDDLHLCSSTYKLKTGWLHFLPVLCRILATRLSGESFIHCAGTSVLCSARISWNKTT